MSPSDRTLPLSSARLFHQRGGDGKLGCSSDRRAALLDEGKENVPGPRATAGDRAGDRGVRRCCSTRRARCKEEGSPVPAGGGEAPPAVGRAGDAVGDARRRAMTRTGDGADAVRLLPRHRQPGGSAVPPAPPPGRGVRGGMGRGRLGRGVPVLREGCSGKGGPSAGGVLGHGGDAWARACLCMRDAQAWEMRGPGGACTGGVCLGVGGMLGHRGDCA